MNAVQKAVYPPRGVGPTTALMFELDLFSRRLAKSSNEKESPRGRYAGGSSEPRTAIEGGPGGSTLCGGHE